MRNQGLKSLLLIIGILAIVPTYAYSGGKLESASGGTILVWLLVVALGIPLVGALLIYAVLVGATIYSPRPVIVAATSIGCWLISILISFKAVEWLPSLSFAGYVSAIAIVALLMASLLNYSICHKQASQAAIRQGEHSTPA